MVRDDSEYGVRQRLAALNISRPQPLSQGEIDAEID